MQPETRYARSGDVRIAFQVIGSGPINLVFVPGFISNLDIAWEHPQMARDFLTKEQAGGMSGAKIGGIGAAAGAVFGGGIGGAAKRRSNGLAWYTRAQGVA